MTKFQVARVVIVVSVLFIFTGTSYADLINFSDRSTWEASLVDVVNEDFSSADSDIELGASPINFGELTISASFSGPYSKARIRGGYSHVIDIDGFYSGDFVEILFPVASAGVGFDYFPGDATRDPLNIYINGSFVASLGNDLQDPRAFFGVIDDSGDGINSLQFMSSNYGMYGAIDVVSWSPVPLPSAAWLLGTGFAGLIGLRKRKK